MQINSDIGEDDFAEEEYHDEGDHLNDVIDELLE